MVISKKHKFIFIHIPKNAGTSIASSLTDLIKENKHWAVSNSTKHQNLRDLILIKENSSIYDKIFKDSSFLDYYKFAIVRNPYDRMISLYNYLKKYEVRKEIHTVDNFETFINLLKQNDSWVSKLHSTKLQLSYLLDSNDNIAVDYIGRYEDLNNSIKEIEEKLLIEIPLKRLNYSSKKSFDFNEYYNKSTMQIVNDKFKEDFEVFNYIVR